MSTIAEELAKAAVTDSLNRAESPIGAPWVKINPGTSAGKCVSVSPVGYTPVTSFAGGEDDCYWSTSPFSSSSSQYIYGIFTLSRIGTAERQASIWLCRDEAKPVETQNGYLLRLEKKAASEIKFTIEKWTGGSVEVIKELTTSEFIAGSQIAFVVGNNKAYMFATTTEGGTYEEKMSVETTTYTKGYSGLRGKGTGEFVVKDFRTGTFTIATEPTRQFTRSPESVLRLTPGRCKQPVDSGKTLVAVIKYEEDGCVLQVTDAGKAQRNPMIGINLGSLLGWGRAAGLSVPKGVYSLVAATKAAGEAKPRLHIYNFSTKTWTHADATEGVATDALSQSFVGLQIGGKLNAVGPFKGGIAAAAWFNSQLSDAQLEELISLGSIGAWASHYPAPFSLWMFNQAAVSEALTDSSIAEANQTERIETSVLAEAPPIPYGAVSMTLVQVLENALVKARRWVMGLAGLVNE